MALSSITNVLLYLTADSSKAQVELNKTFKGIERHSDNLNTKLGKITERQDIIVDSSKKVRKAIEDIANVKTNNLNKQIKDTDTALTAQQNTVKQLSNEYRALKEITDFTLKDNQKYKDRKKSVDDLTQSLKDYNNKLVENKFKLELAQQGTFNLSNSEQKKTDVLKGLIKQEQNVLNNIKEQNNAVKLLQTEYDIKIKGDKELTASQERLKNQIDKTKNAITEQREKLTSLQKSSKNHSLFELSDREYVGSWLKESELKTLKDFEFKRSELIRKQQEYEQLKTDASMSDKNLSTSDKKLILDIVNKNNEIEKLNQSIKNNNVLTEKQESNYIRLSNEYSRLSKQEKEYYQSKIEAEKKLEAIKKKDLEGLNKTAQEKSFDLAIQSQVNSLNNKNNELKKIESALLNVNNLSVAQKETERLLQKQGEERLAKTKELTQELERAELKLREFKTESRALTTEEAKHLNKVINLQKKRNELIAKRDIEKEKKYTISTDLNKLKDDITNYKQALSRVNEEILAESRRPILSQSASYLELLKKEQTKYNKLIEEAIVNQNVFKEELKNLKDDKLKKLNNEIQAVTAEYGLAKRARDDFKKSTEAKLTSNIETLTKQLNESKKAFDELSKKAEAFYQGIAGKSKEKQDEMIAQQKKLKDEIALTNEQLQKAKQLRDEYYQKKYAKFDKEIDDYNKKLEGVKNQLLKINEERANFDKTVSAKQNQSLNELSLSLKKAKEELELLNSKKNELEQKGINKTLAEVEKYNKLIRETERNIDLLKNKQIEYEKDISRKQFDSATKNAEILQKNIKSLEGEYDILVKKQQELINSSEGLTGKQLVTAQKKAQEYEKSLEKIRQNISSVKYELDQIPTNKIDKANQEIVKFEKKIKDTEYNLARAKEELQSFINTKIDKKSQEFQDAQKKVDGLKQSLERLKAKREEVEKAKESGLVRETEKETQKINHLNNQLLVTKKHLDDLNARKLDLVDAQAQRNKINIVSGALFALSNVMYSLIGYTRQLGQEITKAFEGFKTLDADVLQLKALEHVGGSASDILNKGFGQTHTTYNELTESLEKLATKYGDSTDNVAKQVKIATQTGLEHAEALELSDQAMYTAIATQAKFDTVLKGGLKVMANYEVAIKDMPSYFNLMGVVAARSAVGMEDFANKIGYVATQGKGMGVTFAESAVMFGQMTKNLKDPNEAGTAFVNMLAKIKSPASEKSLQLVNDMNKALGLTGKNMLEFGEKGVKQAGGGIKWIEKFYDMAKKTYGVSYSFKEVFRELKGEKGASSLIPSLEKMVTVGGKSMSALSAELEIALKNTDYLKVSFDEMTKSFEFRIKNVASDIKNIFIRAFVDNKDVLEKWWNSIVNRLDRIMKKAVEVLPYIIERIDAFRISVENLSQSRFFNALFTNAIKELDSLGIAVLKIITSFQTLTDTVFALKDLLLNFSIDGFMNKMDKILNRAVKVADSIYKLKNPDYEKTVNKDAKNKQIEDNLMQIFETQRLIKGLAPDTQSNIVKIGQLKDQYTKLVAVRQKLLGTIKEEKKTETKVSDKVKSNVNLNKKVSFDLPDYTEPPMSRPADEKGGNKAYNNAKSSLDKLMRAIEDRYSSEKELAKEGFELESQTSNDISKLQDDYSKKQKAIENQRINDYLALQQGKYEKISVLMGNTRKDQLASFNKEKSLINSILKTETDKIEEIDKRQKSSKENKANLDKQDFERHKQESSERIKIEIARLDLMYKFDKQSLNSKLKILGEKQSKELADFDLMEKKDKNFQAKRANLIQKHANEKADVIEQERLNDINLAEQRYDIELSGKMKTFAVLNEEAEMRAFYAKERVKNEKDSADKIAKIEHDLKLKKQDLSFENLDFYFKSAEQFGQAMANSTSETAKNIGNFAQMAGQAGGKIVNLAKDIASGNLVGIVQTAVVEIGNSIARIIENFEELNSLINSSKASFQDFVEVGVKGFKAIPIVGDLVYSVMRGVTDIIGLTMKESEKEARKKLNDLQKEYGKFLTELKTRSLQEKRDQLQREKDEEIKALNATKGLRVSEALLKRAEIEDRYKEIHSLDKQIAEAEKDSSNEVMTTRLKNQKKTFAQRVQLIKQQAIIDGNNASKSYANETELSNKLDVIKMNSINEMTEVKKEALQFELDFIKDIWSEQLQFHNDRLKQIEKEKQAELDAIKAVDKLQKERDLEQGRKKGAGEQFTKSLKSAKYGEDFFRKTEEEFQTWLEDEQGKIDIAYNVTGEMNKEQFMKANRELAIQSASYLQRRLTGTPDAPTAAKLLTEQNQLENQKETLKSLLETAKKTKDTLKQEEIKNNLELLSASILNLKQLREGNKLLKGKSETTKKLQQAQMLFLENSYDLEMEKAVEQDNETRENAKTLGELAEKEKRNIKDIKDKKAEAEAEVRKEYLKSGDEWLNGMDSRLNTFINSAKTYFTTDIQNSINQLNFSGVGKSFETIKGYFNESIDQANNVLKKISELGIKNKEQVPTTQTSLGSGYTETTLPSGESYGVGGSGSPYSRENMLLESAMQHPKWKTDKVGALIESGASYDEAIKLSGGTDSYKQSKTTSPFGSITPDSNNPFYVPPTNKQTDVDKWIEQANKIALGQFGDGGVIDKPTFALMGERGAETVFNADQMRNLHSMIANYRGGGNSSNTNVNIIFSGQINANNQNDINTIADKVSKVITKQLVRQI